MVRKSVVFISLLAVLFAAFTPSPALGSRSSYWYELGVRKNLVPSPNEIAFPVDRPSNLGPVRKRILAKTLNAKMEVSSGGKMTVLKSNGPITPTVAQKSVVAVLGLLGNMAPVYYGDGRAPQSRLVPTGRVLIHVDGDTRARALLLSESLDLKGARKTGWDSSIYVAKAQSPQRAVELANRLQESGLVIYAYPEWLSQKSLMSVPGDPLFADQWHLLNTGQNGATPGEDIRATEAWNSVQGDGRRVAIVDDSLQVGHPDLAANIASEGHWDFVDGDSDPSPASSDDRHGVSVAGIVAARGFNGIGLSGVAPHAQLVGRRLALNDSFSSLDAANALSSGASGIDVFNCSWGDTEGSLSYWSPVLRSAIKSGTTTGRNSKGSVYVFAAGNGGDNGDNANYSSISNSRYVIAVAASDADGKKLDYSEPGACVLVNAPSGPAGGSDGGCVAKASLSSSPANASAFARLYSFRDDFLAKSPVGRDLSDEYYKYSLLVVGHSLLDASTKVAAKEAIVSWLPLLDSLKGDGDRVLTSYDIQVLEQVVERLKGIGNKQLSADLDREMGFAHPERFAGRTIRELWDAYVSARATSTDSAEKLASPLSDSSLPYIPTTDRTGTPGYNPETTDNGHEDYMDQDYTKYFNGTSAAAPIVSGVAALVIEANPNLGWRDVWQVLAATASKNDPGDPDWTLNGAGYHVNHKYGFGRVDAAQAVARARTWAPVGPETVATGDSYPNAPIPDDTGYGVSDSIYISQEVKTERVEVDFTAADHTEWGDLEVVLISPAGTRSVLAEQHSTSTSARYDGWTFSSVRSLGEGAKGTWTLQVTDKASGDSGTFNSWSLRIYGTQKLQERVADPVLSPQGGTQRGHVDVEISCATPNADIRYTTDGSEPTQYSAQYVVPIRLTSTTTIKAKAFRRDFTNSATTSATFTFPPRFNPRPYGWSIINGSDYERGDDWVVWQRVFGADGWMSYDLQNGTDVKDGLFDGGNCYGMAASAMVNYTREGDISAFRLATQPPYFGLYSLVSMFGPRISGESNARKFYQYGVNSPYQAGLYSDTEQQIREYIEEYQLLQYLIKDRGDTNSTVAEIKRRVDAGETPAVVCISDRGHGHALLAYDYQLLSDGQVDLMVYDCNHPGSSSQTIHVKNGVWRYALGWEDWSGTGKSLQWQDPNDIINEGSGLRPMDSSTPSRVPVLLQSTNARVLLTDTAGRRHGYTADATLLEEIPGARSIYPDAIDLSALVSDFSLTTNDLSSVEVRPASTGTTTAKLSDGSSSVSVEFDGVAGESANVITNPALDSVALDSSTSCRASLWAGTWASGGKVMFGVTDATTSNGDLVLSVTSNTGTVKNLSSQPKQLALVAIGEGWIGRRTLPYTLAANSSVSLAVTDPNSVPQSSIQVGEAGAAPRAVESTPFGMSPIALQVPAASTAGRNVVVQAVVSNSIPASIVHLQSSVDRKKWVDVGTFTTTTNGAITKTIAFSSNRWLRAVVPSSAQMGSASSSAVFLPVRANLRLTAPTTAVRSRSFRVYGTVSPAHTARYGVVRVYLYHLESGRWVSRGSIASSMSSRTAYRAYVRLRYSGSWKLVAQHKDTGHADSRSIERLVKVR